MKSINDFRARSARSEMELKSILLPHCNEVWHLSPADSPDLLAERKNGKLVFIEVKAISKTNFDKRRDDDTKAQSARLQRLYERGKSVFYAVKFMGRGWRFYSLGGWGGARSLPEGAGLTLAEFLAYIDAP